MNHHHHHSHLDRNSSLLFKVLLLTVGFMVAEVVVGLISNSLTILADAGHMFTDAFALGLSWIAIHYSKKPANSKFTYGYHRLQVLAALINGLSLFALSVYIIWAAAVRIFAPVPLEGQVLVWTGLLGAAVNCIALWMVSKSSHQDMNMRSVLLHILSDLLGSAAAFVSGVVIIYTGWVRIDPVLSLFISALLLRTTWRLIKQSSLILMEVAPTDIDVQAIKAELLQMHPMITDIHHVHTWSISPTSRAITFHVVANGSIQVRDKLIKSMREALHSKFGIDHTTIQLESERCDEADEGS